MRPAERLAPPSARAISQDVRAAQLWRAVPGRAAHLREDEPGCGDRRNVEAAGLAVRGVEAVHAPVLRLLAHAVLPLRQVVGALHANLVRPLRVVQRHVPGGRELPADLRAQAERLVGGQAAGVDVPRRRDPHGREGILHAGDVTRTLRSLRAPGGHDADMELAAVHQMRALLLRQQLQECIVLERHLLPGQLRHVQLATEPLGGGEFLPQIFLGLPLVVKRSDLAWGHIHGVRVAAMRALDALSPVGWQPRPAGEIHVDRHVLDGAPFLRVCLALLQRPTRPHLGCEGGHRRFGVL
mmetsp:Transcript_16153/g.47914  ORF Transcript_16153/g.47914 Transcript_16153/m.47914 type:complete len:297 (-) Transcript_16153:240-1130(-)